MNICTSYTRTKSPLVDYAAPYTLAPRATVTRTLADRHQGRAGSHSWWVAIGDAVILQSLVAVVFFVMLWSALQFEGMPQEGHE
jgi:hypothetical protein